MDLGDRVRVVVDPQTLLGEAECEKSDSVVPVETRSFAQITEGIGHCQSCPGVGHQLLALVDDRARHGVLKDAFRQLHLGRLAFAGLT